MSIFSEGFDALNSTDSGLSESVEYHAGLEAEPVTWSGVFNELPRGEIVDDIQGRRSPNRGRLQLAREQDGESITIAETGKAWFVIRGETWFVRGVLAGQATFTVELEVMRDQSIRRPQSSTRK